MRVWSHKRNHIARPNGRAVGCRVFCEENWPRCNGTTGHAALSRDELSASWLVGSTGRFTCRSAYSRLGRHHESGPSSCGFLHALEHWRLSDVCRIHMDHIRIVLRYIYIVVCCHSCSAKGMVADVGLSSLRSHQPPLGRIAVIRRTRQLQRM